MKYPFRATVYRRAAAATTNSRGRKPAGWDVIATDHPLDVQASRQDRDGGVVATPAGRVRQGTWRGFIAPGLEIRPDDRIRLEAPRAGIPSTFRVADVYPLGGRWDTQAELEVSGEPLP